MLNTKISFWLIPSAAYRPFFQEIINSLSKAHNSPNFEPHVTMYSGDYTADESVDELIETAVKNVSGFMLDMEQLGYTDLYTKTLFVQFKPSAILTQVSETLRHNSAKPSDYVLSPHLSLLYQHLDQAVKEKLATELVIPYTQVFFNEVRAISTPEPVRSGEDVEKWQTLSVRKLE
ncbi:MAG: cyclic phosphodiesterase-like protein [Coleofasciculus sp. G1-WW12-02]|uniref:2'-5' RNA ligase family protein n=1 Tax=Coleofasciculus sp. G1-WW12-02 TaxID=3068483 RepID=UPI0032FD5951